MSSMFDMETFQVLLTGRFFWKRPFLADPPHGRNRIVGIVRCGPWRSTGGRGRSGATPPVAQSHLQSEEEPWFSVARDDLRLAKTNCNECFGTGHWWDVGLGVTPCLPFRGASSPHGALNSCRGALRIHPIPPEMETT